MSVPAEVVDINRGLISTADLVNSDDSRVEVSMSTGTTLYQHGTPVLICPKGPHDRLFPYREDSDPSALAAHQAAMARFCSDITGQPQSHQVPFAASLQASAEANLVWTYNSDAERVAFLSRALGAPPTSTILRAFRRSKPWIINAGFVTTKMIRQNDPNLIATSLGYLERQRQHHSGPRPRPHVPRPQETDPATTATDAEDPDADTITDELTDLSIHHDLHNTLVVTYIEMKRATLSMDAAGDYPIVSSQGHTGTLVTTLGGAVKLIPMIGHSGTAHLAAVTEAFLYFHDLGKGIHRIMTDPETSAEVQQFYKDRKVPLQLAITDLHRQLVAELKVKFFKRQFIATRASIDDRFPDNEWHRLLPHIELMLQVLHPAASDHTISAYMWLNHKPFDWDRYPLAPPATMVVAFTPRDQRHTWDDHGWVGWYMGPDLTTYRGFNIWDPTTNAYSTVGTVAWFPRHVKMPGFYTHDRVQALLSDVVTELKRTTRATPEVVAGVQQLTMALDNMRALYATPALEPDTPSIHPTLPRAIEDVQAAYDVLQRVRPPTQDYNRFHPLQEPKVPLTPEQQKQLKKVRRDTAKAAKQARVAEAIKKLQDHAIHEQQQAVLLQVQPPPPPVDPPAIPAPVAPPGPPPAAPRRVRAPAIARPVQAANTPRSARAPPPARPAQAVAVNNPRLEPHRTRQQTRPRPQQAVHAAQARLPLLRDTVPTLDSGSDSDNSSDSGTDSDDDTDGGSDSNSGSDSTIRPLSPLIRLHPGRPRQTTAPHPTPTLVISPDFYQPLSQSIQRVPQESAPPPSSEYSWGPDQLAQHQHTPGASGTDRHARKQQASDERRAAAHAESTSQLDAVYDYYASSVARQPRSPIGLAPTVAAAAVLAALLSAALPLLPDPVTVQLADLSDSELAEVHAAFMTIVHEQALTDKASRTSLHPHLPSAEANTVALNLTPAGKPLTWQSAKRGPNAPAWHVADVTEFHKQLRPPGQGGRGVLNPIMYAEIPAERIPDITGFIKAVREKQTLEGDKTYRVRGTADGRFVHYPGDTAAKTAEMAAVKMLLQSVPSDGAKWLTLDISDFYIMHDLVRKEYVRIRVTEIPQEIMDEYQLQQYIHHGCVHFQVNKALYGLPEAGLLSQQQLVARLAAADYIQTATPCLFRHVSNGVTFALVVDDFGVKYTDKAGADHLIQTLRELYDVKVDWIGSKFLGYTVAFNDARTHVTLSLPGYIAKALQRFGVPPVKAYSPAIYIHPAYGKPAALVAPNTAPPLTAPERTRLQEIIGVLLYYGRAVDCTILPVLSSLASEQAAPTEQLWPAVNRLLAYLATYPDNQLVLTACDMILHTQSDASYLTRSGGRSVVGGYHFLGDHDQPTRTNGAILAICTVIPVVVASAAEAEYAGVFINAQEAFHLRNILADLGYPQPPTTIFCDNACAVGLANDTVKEKRSKSIDMRWHWIRDRIRQLQFNVVWRCGANNLADFFTKALAVKDHQAIQPLLVSSSRTVSTLPTD